MGEKIMLDMIDEFFDVVNASFTFVIVVIIVTVVIAAIVKGREYYKDKKQKRKIEQEMCEGVNKIKAASKYWSKEQKVNYMNYLSEEYDRLEEAKNKPFGQGWACKTVIMANIDGDMDYFSVDLEALRELYYYIRKYY